MNGCVCRLTQGLCASLCVTACVHVAGRALCGSVVVGQVLVAVFGQLCVPHFACP